MDQALFAEQVLKYAEMVVSNSIFPIAEGDFRSLRGTPGELQIILNSCSRPSSLRKLSIEKTI